MNNLSFSLNYFEKEREQIKSDANSCGYERQTKGKVEIFAIGIMKTRNSLLNQLLSGMASRYFRFITHMS